MRKKLVANVKSGTFSIAILPKFGGSLSRLFQSQHTTSERTIQHPEPLLLTMSSNVRQIEQEEHDGGNSRASEKVNASLLSNTESENRSVAENSDDDDETVIILDRQNAMDSPAALWAEQDSPELEERRRSILLRELQRVQRASFVHFLVLCLIPTSLLLIVVITVLREDDLCESSATLCEEEARTFINAFTTRCVCNAIPVTKEDVGGSP